MKLGPLTFQCACLAWCMRSILSASRAFRITITSARVMAGRSFFVVYIAFAHFEVMRAWSLSDAQECSRVCGISCCRGDRATRVPRVKPGHELTMTLCFCMCKYRKSPQGNTSRSVRFSDTRTGEWLKFGRWARWGEGHSTSEPCAVAASKWRLRIDKEVLQHSAVDAWWKAQFFYEDNTTAPAYWPLSLTVWRT